MTPRELCDLASKINAAVPGLVPDFITTDRDTRVYVGHPISEGMPTAYAAAMMLGMVTVAREQMDEASTIDDIEKRSVLVKAECELWKYVATTLPGAKQ